MFRKIYAGIYLIFYCMCASGNVSAESLANLIAEDKYDEAVQNIEQYPESYLHELITRARGQSLWNDAVWKKLVHYKKNPWGGYTSQVDGADFFNSAAGKSNPQAEMEATIARFFSTRVVAPTTLPPHCRFIARYQWLNEKLGFDVSRMPDGVCVPFNELRDALKPEAISIIFPSAHPNSPSSMFGHTFARIDRKGQVRETRMLDFTINYAAQVDSGNTLVYAVKGLTGGFEGRFNVLPYHLKLREYVQMENRDLWEYKLTLTPQQVEIILQHAYELIPTYFDYYFFTENCAYHLLSLMEVALPDLDLSDEFSGWTIPVDTLKLLNQKHGMVHEVTYQPSNKAIILARRESLTPQENSLALQTYKYGIANTEGELLALDQDRQAAVLDLAFDYLRYTKIKKADEFGPNLSKEERDLLLARSKVKVRSTPPNVQQPGVRPDQGHETSRFSVSTGRSDHRNYAQIDWRAAYHDLLDPSPGYAWNSKLDFFNAQFRRYAGDDKIEVHKFSLIDILSLEPRDEFFNHVSWHAFLGSHARDIYGQRHSTIIMEGGPGLTYELPLFHRSLVYGLIQASGNYASGYKSNFLPGLGFLGGLLLKINPSWTAQLETDSMRSVGSNEIDSRQVALRQSFILKKNVTLNLTASYNKSIGHRYSETSGGLNIYF